MTTLNAEAAKNPALPQELRTALAAVDLPEVQEMIRKLKQYNMGVVALHGHDDETGHFTPFPDGKMQVESDLKVTFEDKQSVLDRIDDYIPVGWQWEDDGTKAMAVCNTVCLKRGTDTNHYAVHEKNA